MKALLAFLTSCSLAAGFVVGYLEHRERQAGAPTTAPEARKVPPPAKVPEPKRPAQPAPKEEARPKAAPAPSKEEVAAAVREVEALLRKEDFDAARKAAGAAAARYAGDPAAEKLLEAVRRAERKIDAYRAIISRLEARQLPEVLFLVDLSNGGRFTAKSRKDAGDRWEFEHVLGGVSSHPKAQATVKPIPRKDYLDARWKEIQEYVKDRKDPYDIYFFGVKKCFRDGLRKEGISLIDRLLAMADSGSLVAMFADRDIALAWEEAAGRKSIPGAEPPVEVARDGGDAEKKPEPPDTPSAPPGGSVADDEPDDGGTLDPQALARAQTLVKEAEDLCASAGGNSDKLWDARMRAQSVAKLLYGLGLPRSDSRVADLYRRTQALLEKVMGEKE